MSAANPTATTNLVDEIVRRYDSQRPGESEVVRGVSWDQYWNLLDATGERRFRHTYDEGVLEFMTKGYDHESEAEFLGLLVAQLCITLGWPFKLVGSTTQWPLAQKKGVEPDKCFYVTNAPKMKNRGGPGDKLDFEQDPPPDLFIEVDITSSSLPRLPIFAAIGIPEVWRIKGTRIVIKQLADGAYRDSEQSLAFPFLSSEKLNEWFSARGRLDEYEIIAEVVAWVRENQSA